MNLRAQLIELEGWENEAYPDPLTGAEPWTIGVGHTGSEVHKGLVWADEKIGETLDTDMAEAMQESETAYPWVKTLNDPRRAVIIGMCFQMGLDRLAKFKNTLRSMADGHFEDAAAGMLASKWAVQTPKRVKRLAQQMRTGEWQ